MAIRIPKQLTDLFGALGGPDVGSIRGFWFGPTAPPDATWIWVVTDGVAPSQPVSIQAAAALLGVTTPAPGVQAIGAPLAIAAQAVALGLVTSAPSVAALGSVLALSPTAALIGMTASAPGVVALTGGGGGLGNGDFEAALAGSLGEGNWYPSTWAGPTGMATVVAERSAASPITGTYRGRLAATGFEDYETYSDPGSASLTQRVPKSALASTPTLGFKCRNDGGMTSGAVGVGLDITLRDSGGADITDKTNGKNVVKLWGDGFYAATNTTIAFVPSGTTVYDKSFNLNTFAESILAAGKVAGDIANVDVGFYAYASSESASTLSLDDVALS